MHIHWGKTLDAFENQQRSSSLNMRILIPITHFRILVIPEAITFGAVGALNTLINIISGFCDNREILFLPIMLYIF